MQNTIIPWSPAAADQAAQILRDGRLVVVPTETVYGLAADATSERAVARVFEAKGRPSFNPLIIHVRNLEMARDWAEMPPMAEKLAAAFWPGPLTLVLPRKANTGLSRLVSAGLDTVAIRCPAAEPAQMILQAFDRPFAAPSANRSGAISPTLVEHAIASLGDKVDLYIDNGPCPVGVESTILKVTEAGVQLLRPGGLATEDIQSVSGALLDPTKSDKPQAPGMLASHYAPNAKLRLNATDKHQGEVFLAFGASPAGIEPDRNLSEAGSLVEAAANLFRQLHELDAISSKIAVAPVPEHGLGVAINDRLSRAAAPR